MSEKVNMKDAKEVYRTLIDMMDARKWPYEKDADNLSISGKVDSDDLPIEFKLSVIPEFEVVQLISPLPINTSEEKRADIAMGVCAINFGLVNGSFDFDVKTGLIEFRLTTSYKETDLSDELLEHMIMVAGSTIDDYNERLLFLSKGMITVEKFIEQV